MRRFTRLYLELDATGSTSEKIGLLEGYFREVPEADGAWGLALLTGNRPRRAASTRVLRALAMEVAQVPEWLLDACYAQVGDLSETIALLLPDGSGGGSSGEALHVVMERRVLPLIEAGEEERAAIIREAWGVMDSDERLVYHKLIRGGFRIGVQKRLVARAMALVAGVDVKIMAQRLTATIEPSVARYRAILSGEGDGEGRLTPMPFFLANQLDRGASELGGVSEWVSEWKYDGIRAQVVVRDGEVAVWSRGEELITHQFPEVATAAAVLGRDCIVDGEILIWDEGPRPFAELQTRLNRKVAPMQPGLFERARVVFIAFDLLVLEGEDLRGRGQMKRRGMLDELLSSVGDETIRLSPLIEESSWEALAAARETSRGRGVEGLMLKHREAAYGVGRERSERGWWKWKVDPYSVDAVLVSSQPGSGRRASLYTDHTFALWDGEGDERRLVTFCKAYSGLTQEEIEELDRWIRAHTIKKAGPFRQVEAAQVFEIAFEGVRVSRRHKSGVAVRFPRIARWRREKGAGEADEIGALRRLVVSGASVAAGDELV